MSDVADNELAWEARWRAAKLGEAPSSRTGPKYFLIFAYPGTSGFMHLGHFRGYSYADAFARYHRLKGERVFFPFGAHASGLPSVTFADRVSRRDPDIMSGLAERGVGEERLAELAQPEGAARYLGETYWTALERLGFLMDRRAYVTTIDPDYQQFIRWQFQRLRAGGHLVQKPHYAPFCPKSGPVSVDPSETDLSKGGNAEIIVYTALPFELEDGRRLLAATLRPETVFGATNVWLPESGDLTEWRFQGRTHLLSASGAQKMVDQVGGEIGGTQPVAGLLGSHVTAPLTGERLPLWGSPLVQLDRGTGVVMSVPAHAPADWVALFGPSAPARGLTPDQVPTIIEIPTAQLAASDRNLLEGSGPPALRITTNLKVKDLSDAIPLQEATERLYRIEQVNGRVLVGPYAGESVAVARERVSKSVLTEHGGFEVREFSEPVVCRCGETVVIRRIPDQWFLAYGDAAWKSETLELVDRLSVVPQEYRDELPGILDWFEDRPAVRRGKWLGTPFPDDPRWIIEPIADSTFYPAYYTVRPFVADGRLKAEQLTPAFFDKVLSGQGPGEPSVTPALHDEVRANFLAWYPLDLNLGGKEHKRVHFPVFLYTHAALLPPDLRPRGLYVNWWLTNYAGDKLSKKDVKGGAIPAVDTALERWGADGLRLYFAISASPQQDVSWDETTCQAAFEHARGAARLAETLWGGPGTKATPLKPGTFTKHPDLWLSTRMARLISEVTEAWESLDIRRASQITYVEIPAAVRRYQARGGANAALQTQVADVLGRLMVPVTPHLAEKVSEGHRTGFVSVAPLPRAEDFPSGPESERREAIVQGVEEDLSALLKAWKGPTGGLVIFVADAWKAHVDELVRASSAPGGGRIDISAIMKAAKADPTLRDRLAELPKYLAGASPGGKGAGAPLPTAEESTLLSEAIPYLVQRFSLPSVQVYSEGEGAPHDPAQRRGRARPGRPALYLLPVA